MATLALLLPLNGTHQTCRWSINLTMRFYKGTENRQDGAKKIVIFNASVEKVT